MSAIQTYIDINGQMLMMHSVFSSGVRTGWPCEVLTLSFLA